ncbi:transcriptional regulator GlxA family with amidase domain [Psychromicrobium silvestre]|uniref:Transcriptional regulator GlxA family with amidase domain n=1 Tax=Psychromicrobium silvestre TaxID=1645614 RepID=A0A7Y9LT73_9MICC|nr:transcriptional regulator GlxA family with amidase domain [Psychromicrobium silvestre]
MLAQIVLFDGFDPLDVVAPFEVLAAGSDALGGTLDVKLVSAEGSRTVVSGTRGLTLEASASLDPSSSGIIVVPGASGPINADPEEVDTIPVLLARVGETPLPALITQALANPEITVATVCGGSLALAMAGVLEGRNAVTHFQGMDVLDATGVNAIDARVVDDGNLVTAAGVTSGLDLGLYLLERQFGPRIALSVEQLFQYERRGVVWRNTGAEPLAV